MKSICKSISRRFCEGLHQGGIHRPQSPKQPFDLKVWGYWQRSKISDKVPSGNHLSIILHQTQTETLGVCKGWNEKDFWIYPKHILLLQNPLRQSKCERNNRTARNHTTLKSISPIDLFLQKYYLWQFTSSSPKC